MRTVHRAIRTPEGWRTDVEMEIQLQPTAKRVRVEFAGETIADTTDGLLLHETRHLPVYYLPRDDVRMDLMTRTNHSTHCPHKGDASYWTVRVGERMAENAVWGYDTPFDHLAPLKDYVAFYWSKMDRWLEEDEEVFVHARDPYKRIDVLESKRLVQVIVGGITVGQSNKAVFLFETGLPPRYYLPAEDVRQDALVPSDTQTACPYKGEAEHFDVVAGGERAKDGAWRYADPLPEVGKIAGRICFYDERVDAVYLDGEMLEKPKTKWSA